MKRQRVYFRVIKDYFPKGFAEPLLKKGEITWIEAVGAEDIALGLARAGYVHRIGRRGRPEGGPVNDRSRAILERLEAGTLQSEVAAEFGITHQAVSQRWTRHQTRKLRQGA